jgi:hypothetical protein
MMTRNAGRRRILRCWVIVAALCAVLSAIPLAVQAAVPAAVSATGTATISVSAWGRPSGALSNHFIGLSFESQTLNSGYRYDDVGNLPQLLENLGTSVIRFGGNSADTTFGGVTAGEAAALARLAQATHWKVLYTENLANFNAAQVTADARLVAAALGRSLYAFACGNEPDEFAHDGIRAPGYTPADYITQVNACYNAIRGGDPGAEIEGPDTAGSSVWLAQYAAAEAGTIRALGEHYYALGCSAADRNRVSAVVTLLSAAQAAREETRLGGYLAAAQGADAPLRVTETNSACGGGIAGLSNAYATALWVIDYMLIGAEQGVEGMNFHGGLDTSCAGYTVLCQAGPNMYQPQPIYYGMLFTRLLGTGQFLPVQVSTSSAAENIAAFALAGGGGIRVMLENLGRQTTAAVLRLSGYRGPASRLNLTGPSPLATSGVEIQGASVAANGTLTPGQPDTVSCTPGGCSVTLAPYSAAMVTVG